MTSGKLPDTSGSDSFAREAGSIPSGIPVAGNPLSEVKLEVTWRCPLACLHCSSEASPGSSIEMTADGCLQVLEQASALGTKEVAFSGGEPLLWPPLTSGVAKARRFADRVVLYSTGVAEDLDARLLELREAGLTDIVFSLHGPEAGEHERVTQVGGSFERTCDAIKAASQLALAVELHTVAFSSTHRRLADVVRLASGLGARRTSVLRFVPQGRGQSMLGEVLDRTESLELRNTVQQLREEGYDLRLGSPWNYLLPEQKVPCMAARDRVVVSPTLHVFPCDAFKQMNPRSLVGSDDLWCLEESNLDEIWQHSPFLKAVRETHMSSRSGLCGGCDVLPSCGAGCMAQRALVGGLSWFPDPGCLREGEVVPRA